MQASIAKNNRIESIDIVRGIAMVIMALDHVRDFVHIQANVDDPLNLQTTTPILFFTRWITHFCAPTFVFLSGTSIYLQSLRKSKKELSSFLIKRGLWLVFAEITIITFAWTFNPFLNVFALQVIWAIGMSMIVLGIFIGFGFSYQLIFAIGLMIVFGHNLLDIPEATTGFKAGFWWDLLHHSNFAFYQVVPNHFVIIAYAFPIWAGVMMLGYCAGKFFTSSYTQQKRFVILSKLGIGLIALFIVLRFLNIYGDPVKWTTQPTALYTFLSFINVFKYPPSLMYLCITIGTAFILLAFLEKIKNRLTDALTIYGRTAFFYYILHFYIIHIVATILFFTSGKSVDYAIKAAQELPFLFVIKGEGYSLSVVYILWIGLVVALYPLCKKYDRYKIAHKEKWWLSYL